MEGCQDQEGEGSCREGARVNECLNKSIAETSLGADKDEEGAEEEEFDDLLNKGGGLRRPGSGERSRCHVGGQEGKGTGL